MSCINNHRCGTCPHPCKTDVRNKEHQKWFVSLPLTDRAKLLGLPYPNGTRAVQDVTQTWLDKTRDEREALIAASGLYRNKGNKQTALGHDF